MNNDKIVLKYGKLIMKPAYQIYGVIGENPVVKKNSYFT